MLVHIGNKSIWVIHVAMLVSWWSVITINSIICNSVFCLIVLGKLYFKLQVIVCKVAQSTEQTIHQSSRPEKWILRFTTLNCRPRSIYSDKYFWTYVYITSCVHSSVPKCRHFLRGFCWRFFSFAKFDTPISVMWSRATSNRLNYTNVTVPRISEWRIAKWV